MWEGRGDGAWEGGGVCVRERGGVEGERPAFFPHARADTPSRAKWPMGGGQRRGRRAARAAPWRGSAAHKRREKGKREGKPFPAFLGEEGKGPRLSSRTPRACGGQGKQPAEERKARSLSPLGVPARAACPGRQQHSGERAALSTRGEKGERRCPPCPILGPRPSGRWGRGRREQRRDAQASAPTHTLLGVAPGSVARDAARGEREGAKKQQDRASRRQGRPGAGRRCLSSLCALSSRSRPPLSADSPCPPSVTGRICQATCRQGNGGGRSGELGAQGRPLGAQREWEAPALVFARPRAARALLRAQTTRARRARAALSSLLHAPVHHLMTIAGPCRRRRQGRARAGARATVRGGRNSSPCAVSAKSEKSALAGASRRKGPSPPPPPPRARAGRSPLPTPSPTPGSLFPIPTHRQQALAGRRDLLGL